jgi:hypothetical protein
MNHVNSSTVGRIKPCFPCPLEVKYKGVRGMGGVASKGTCTFHTVNIISRQ